jgi:hypothetical protein
VIVVSLTVTESDAIVRATLSGDQIWSVPGHIKSRSSPRARGPQAQIDQAGT